MSKSLRPEAAGMYVRRMGISADLLTSSPLRVCPALPGFEAERAWTALRQLEAVYPGFRSWFFELVVPGLADGSRRIFERVGPHGLEGLVIAKRKAERKLCTIWTADHARGRGIAAELILEASEWLGTEKPLLTVPEERLSEFRSLLNRLDYCEVEALQGWYRPGKTEHVFNAQLRPETIS